MDTLTPTGYLLADSCRPEPSESSSALKFSAFPTPLVVWCTPPTKFNLGVEFVRQTPRFSIRITQLEVCVPQLALILRQGSRKTLEKGLSADRHYILYRAN